MSSVAQPLSPLPSETEWKDVLEEILPPMGRWSEDEYLVLTGHRNRLVEFTDRFLEILPTPTDKHQSVLTFLFLAFYRFARPRGGKVHFAPFRPQIGQASSTSPICFAAFSRQSAPRESFLAGRQHPH